MINNENKNNGIEIKGFKSASNKRVMYILKKLASFIINNINVPKNKKLGKYIPKIAVFINFAVTKTAESMKLTIDNL